MSKKVLLDECLPRRLVRDLGQFATTTVPQKGWAGKKDAELLRLASGEFDVFVTLDSNLVYQQNVSNLDLGIVVLHVKSSRYESIQPIVSQLCSAIGQLESNGVVDIG